LFSSLHWFLWAYIDSTWYLCSSFRNGVVSAWVINCTWAWYVNMVCFHCSWTVLGMCLVFFF
jgi:hypothetical protein